MSWEVPTLPQEELAKKRAKAKEDVYKVWMDRLQNDKGEPKRDGMSDDERVQMGRDVEVADAKAILDYVMGKLLLTILPGAVGLQSVVSLGAPTGPPAAPVPLQPGIGVMITFKPPTP